MYRTDTIEGSKNSFDFHAEVKFQKKPLVKLVLINGVEMYEGIGEFKGKLYVPDIFDRYFNPPGGKVLPMFATSKTRARQKGIIQSDNLEFFNTI